MLVRIIKWLSAIGALTASTITIPKVVIQLGEGRAWRLDQDLPLWALGLGVVIIALIIFKVITHVVLKVLMWGALVILIVIILSQVSEPIGQWFASFGGIAP